MFRKTVCSFATLVVITGCANGGAGNAQLSQTAGALGEIVSSQLGGTVGDIVNATAKTVTDVGTQQSNLVFAGEREAAKKFDDEIIRSRKLINDPVAQSYLNAIVRRLSPHRRNAAFPVTARIIDDPVYNAFTPGGGFLYVNSGLIAGLGNEAQLAMVVAHEIAHIDEGHIAGNRYSNVAANAAGRFGDILLQNLGLQGGGQQLAATGAGLGIGALKNSYSRAQESVADDGGFKMIVAAGYDAREASRTFDVLASVSGPESKLGNLLFSGHPLNSERQQTLSQAALGRAPGDTGERTYTERMGGIFLHTADALIERGEFVPAEKIMFRARSSGLPGPRVPFNLGRIAQAKRSEGVATLDDAIIYYREAIGIDPNFADAHRALGMAFLEQSDTAKALPSLKQYVRLTRNFRERDNVQNLINRLEGRA